MNSRILYSLLPAAIFWTLWRITETWIAILCGFGASLLVLRYNRDQRLIGFLTVFGLVIVGMSGLVGVIWDSPKAYLASGPVSDFLFVPVYLVSIAIGKPLVGGIARELFPAIAGRLPIDHSLFVTWSFAWAAFNLVQGFVRWWMLTELSVGQYLVWTRVVFWPLSIAMLSICGWMILRESQKHPAGHHHEGDAEPVPA